MVYEDIHLHNEWPVAIYTYISWHIMMNKSIYNQRMHISCSIYANMTNSGPNYHFFFLLSLLDLEILWNSRMRLGPLPEQCRSEKLYFRSRDGRNWDAGETWGGLGGGISTWGVAKLGNSETQGESNMGRRKGRIWFGDDDFVELLWAIGPQVFDEVESLFQPDEGSSDENWNG